MIFNQKKSLVKFAAFVAVGFGVVYSISSANLHNIYLPWEKAPVEQQASIADQTDVVSVQNAIEKFRLGMIERKPEMILELSDPQLTFGHSNGVVQTREEFAEVVRSGAEVFKRVELSNQNLVVTGSTAVERHHFSADIVYQGELMNFELEVVEVWKKSAKDWRLIARQAVKI